MRKFGAIFILMLSILLECDDPNEISNNTNPEFPPGYGILEFHFVMPEYSIPEEKVHRISLNLAYNVEALYRAEFLYKKMYLIIRKYMILYCLKAHIILML